MIATLAAALVDRYRIERELGAGGMATVHLAEDLKHKRKVAIKVLRAEVGAALGSERFLREIETTANLRHPHILPLYDSGSVDGFLYYVMPLVEGESLRDRLTREKQLPIADALRIAREVADALSYAHARGVVHRDIKPENILLEGGHAVVADFGIARAFSAAGGERITQTGMSVGTPLYMSPEQSVGDGELDGRSDLYSLACVLYEMLGGQAPFTGPTAESIVRQRLVTDAPPITNLRPAVPAVVADALQRALARNPADRFNPVAQFSAAIEAASPAAAVSLPAPQTPTAAAPRASVRARRLAWAAAAFVVVLAVVLSMAWRRAASVGADEASVAVLPFADLSQERTSEYFGDGIAETLIGALSSVQGLDVAARTSAFSFRGKNVDAREIGRQLGVGAVLEGSVQRAGDRLRISAQLVKASSGTNLWSETFDRNAADIFAVQDEVARAVVTALKGRLLAGQARLGNAEPTHDREAYDLYLQGRFLWNKRAVPDVEKAIGFFERAIQRDSTFALAQAGLADAYIAVAFYSNAATLPTLATARAAAERAVALNPNLGEAHAALAYLTFLEWKLQPADSAFRRAIALNPGYATAHKWYADLLLTDGRAAESLRELLRAKELDPLSAIVMANIAAWHVNNRTDDSALTWIDRALALDPGQPLALSHASSIYFKRGDSSRFFDVRARLDASSSRAGAPVAELRKAWISGGRNAVLRAQLASPRSQGLSVERARWSAQLGDNDAAFRELDSAVAEHSIWAIYVEQFPELDPLRRDPRYALLLKRLGLPAGRASPRP
ncbi:MAG TPA: protein kinase [Gemmatimonadaceae bacterium]|nr:protein kinase [Gemmatimonadaceae bacterium]